MRLFITLIVILNFGSCFSQVILSFPEYTVVYRGYTNVLEAAPKTKTEPGSITLSCEGAELIYKGSNMWNLNPYTPNDSLEILMIDVKTKKVIDRFIYKIKNLPDPILFFGAVDPGGLISKNETRLFVKYDGSFALKAVFQVMGGTVMIGDSIFKINGNRLGNDYLGYAKNVAPGTKVKVEAIVNGPDRVERRISSEYKL